ncbi:MAG: zf-HC2 domain-containing protein [Bacteroidales bacterium]|jgi:hypothetical protein|nr:zf-HC2 domain-containing protein [Bacteroidales bacterium]
MNCDIFKSNLLDFYYNECNKDTCLQMREHLDGCHQCATLFGKISAVLGSADAVKNESPDAFYYTRLSAKITTMHDSPAHTRWLLRIAQPVLAACFAIFGVFVGYKIYDKLQQVEPYTAQIEAAGKAEVQLADEYLPKGDNEEILNTYFFNE